MSESPADTANITNLFTKATKGRYAVTVSFRDKERANKLAARHDPSYAILGPEKWVHLAYLSAKGDEDAARIVATRHAVEDDDMTIAFDVSSIGEGQSLHTADAGALRADEEFYDFTADDIDAVLRDATGDGTTILNDAEVHGEIPSAYLDKMIRVSRAKARDEKLWKAFPEAPFGAFLNNYLTKHNVGKKDGFCFVPGSLIDGKRSNNSVEALYMMGLDVDSGESLEETFRTIRALGLFAVVYTTHSHLSTQLEIKQDRFYKWATDNGKDTDPTDESVKEFLTWQGKFHRDVIASARYVETVHLATGVQINVETRPIDKFRIIFLLNEPYVIAKQKMAHREAIQQWRELVLGVAAKLGIKVDKAATDTARLFFEPRHDAKRPDFRILVNGSGKLLDWTKIKKVNNKGHVTADPFDQAAHIMGGRIRGRQMSPTLGIDLQSWAAQYAEGFMPSMVFREYCEENLRKEINPAKFSVLCPFDDEHSNAGDEEDQGCYVEDAGEAETFSFRCSHDSCQGRDRLHMLEKAMIDGWFPDDALTDSRFLCIEVEDSTAESEDGEETADDDDGKPKRATAAEITRALTAASNAQQGMKTEDIKELLKSLVNMDEFDRNRVLTTLAKNIKVSAAQIQSLYRAVAAEAQAEPYDAAKVAEATRKRHKFLQNEKRPFVLPNMDHPVASLRHVLTELDRANRGDPATGLDPAHMLFDFAGKRARIGKDQNGKRRIDELTQEVITNAASELLYVGKAQDQTVGEDFLDDKLAKQALIDPRLSLLPLDRFVKHPLFDMEGNLLLSSGYDVKTKAFIDLDGLDLSHLDPAKPVVKQDVVDAVAALDHAFGDFNWSGYGEDDSDNGAAGSRAAYYALLLTPFVWEVIDANVMLFGIDKPDAGSGGTLLAECANIIWTGEKPVLDDWPKGRNGEEEAGKLIPSIMMAGRGAIIFDNVQGKVGSAIVPTLSTGKISKRKLGGNEMIEGGIRYPAIFVGNGLKFSDENVRRVLPIRIRPSDVAVDDDGNPKFKVEGELSDYLIANRSTIVGHLITIVRGWFQQPDRPESKHYVKSFARFVKIIGGILQSAGIEGWLAGRDTFTMGSKEEEGDEIAILHDIVDKHGLDKETQLPSTVETLFREIEGGPSTFTRYEARYALLEPCVTNGAVSTLSLGKQLATLKQKDRMITVQRNGVKEEITVRLSTRRSNGNTLVKVVEVKKPAKSAD